MVSLSRIDKIMASLIVSGFSTGSVVDRERARLIAATGVANPSKQSLRDLYRLNNEKPRIR